MITISALVFLDQGSSIVEQKLLVSLLRSAAQHLLVVGGKRHTFSRRATLSRYRHEIIDMAVIWTSAWINRRIATDAAVTGDATPYQTLAKVLGALLAVRSSIALRLWHRRRARPRQFASSEMSRS